MITISNNLKNLIQGDGTLNARIKVYEVEEGIDEATGQFERTETLVDTLEGGDDIISISVDESVADEEGFIGFTSSRSIALEIFTYDNQRNKHDLSGKEIKLEMWCEELPSEVIDYGYYVVLKDGNDIGSETSKYTAYDYMIKLDTPFVDTHRYETVLPSGYTEVEWFELEDIEDENVYIDTGIKLTQDHEVELAVGGLSSGNYKIFGSRTSATEDNFGVLTNGSNMVLDFDSTNTNNLTTPIPSDDIIYIKINNQTLSVNDVSQDISSYNDFETPSNAYIFNMSGTPPTGYYSPNMKIYYCKIYKNGELVRDLVPCYDTHGDYGLYDVIDNEFHVANNQVSATGMGISFTITLKDFVETMLAPTGIELGNQTFTNYNFVINKKPYFENESCRNVLRAVGQMAGTFARIGVDNKLYLKGFETTSETLTESNAFEINEQENDFGPVNSVTIGTSSAVEGEEIKETDAQSITTYGETNITIEDNPFMTNDDQINRAKTGIFNALNGIKFRPFEAKYYGYIYWECGDKITENGNDTYILKHSYSLYGDGNVSAPSLTSTEIKYQSTSVLSAFKDARIQLDRANATITSIASDLEGVATEDDLEKLYKKIQDNDIATLQGSVSRIQQSNDKWEANFIKIFNDESDETSGATNVGNLKNSTVTIDVNGISVKAYGSIIETLTANDGFYILKNETPIAWFTSEGIGVDNLTVNQYLTMGYHRVEGYEDNGNRTGWFYIGG